MNGSAEVDINSGHSASSGQLELTAPQIGRDSAVVQAD